nr:hypothetical protein K03H1.9 - Caenorhabditis elegans [Caenorhabditis elegans]
MESSEECQEPEDENDQEQDSVDLADTYINLGEVQAATAAASGAGQATPESSTQGPSSGNAKSPAPPPAPPLSPAPSPAPLPPPPPPPSLPPPPENALADDSPFSPPRDNERPVPINPVLAPKLFDDINFDSDGKSAYTQLGNPKKSKRIEPEASKKSKGNKKGDEKKKKKKSLQFYFARGCLYFVFVLFMAVFIVWSMVLIVGLNLVNPYKTKMFGFFEEIILHFG